VLHRLAIAHAGGIALELDELDANLLAGSPSGGRAAGARLRPAVGGRRGVPIEALEGHVEPPYHVAPDLDEFLAAIG
jgi:hypothetical protein